MGNSPTSKYYATHPEARKKRLEYQAEFNKKPEQVKKRTELGAINRKAQASGRGKVGDGMDASHTKTGIRMKPASVNRGSKNDMPGDKRARGNSTPINKKLPTKKK